MAPHSSTLAWQIPQMEEPGRLQSTGSLRVGHDWVTSLSRIGEGNGNPLQCSCLESPRDGGAWWAVYGVAQSRTRLKRLSSSSSSSTRMQLSYSHYAFLFHTRLFLFFYHPINLFHIGLSVLVFFFFEVNVLFLSIKYLSPKSGKYNKIQKKIKIIPLSFQI